MSLRNVRAMSGQRFRRTPGGVCSLGLHLVWCPKYRRRVLGGRVALRCGELLDQVAAEHGWEIVAKEVGYVSESTVRRYIEHQWDSVA